MTTIYSGFHRKLKDRRLSWEDRLKIARYAWTAPAAFIPNKQQVLLDWLFGALLNKKKLKIESGDAVLIWRTINDLVRSNFVRSLAKASQLLALRTSATQVMTDALSAASRQHYGPGSNAGLASWVVGACHAVLTAPPLAYLFTSRLKSMSVVLAAAWRLLKEELVLSVEDAQMDMKDSKDLAKNESPAPKVWPEVEVPKVRPEVEALVLAAMDAFLKTKSRQGDQRHVLQSFIEDLLPLSLHLVAHEKLEDMCRQGGLLRAKLNQVLREVLFDIEHKPHYETFVDNTLLPDQDAVKQPPLIKTIFEKLKSAVLESGFLNPAAALKAALEGMKQMKLPPKKRFMACMLILDPILKKKVLSISDLVAVESALHYFSQENLVNPLDETQAKGLTQMFSLCSTSLSSLPASEAVFSTLSHFLACNPTILDKSMVQILSYSWLHFKEENLDLQQARDAFVSQLFSTYGKLRQLDKLFSHLQKAVYDASGPVARQMPCSKCKHCRSGDLLGYCHMSNAKVLEAVEEAGRGLPLGTVLTIWENFHESLKRLIGDALEKLPDEDDNKILFMCKAEVAFLQRLALAHHNIPENLSSNVQNCMETMKELSSRLTDLKTKTTWPQVFHSHGNAQLCLSQAHAKLASILSFYLPHRHPPPDPNYVDYDPSSYTDSLKDYVSLVSDDWLGRSTDWRHVGHWFPYHGSSLSQLLMDKLISDAVEMAVLPDRTGPHQKALTVFCRSFLGTEANFEVPLFIPTLASEILKQISTDISVDFLQMSLEHFRHSTCLLQAIPAFLIPLDILAKVVNRLLFFLVSSSVLDAATLVDLADLVKALLEDVPLSLDTLLQSDPAANFAPLLQQLYQRFVSSATPEALRARLVVVCRRFVAAGFRLGLSLDVASFMSLVFQDLHGLRALTVTEGVHGSSPLQHGESALLAPRLSFGFPLLVLLRHRLHRLGQKVNPPDDQKLEATQTEEKLRKFQGIVSAFVLDDDAPLPLTTRLAGMNAVVTTAKTLDADVEAILAKLAVMAGNEAVPEARVLLMDCFKVALRKPDLGKTLIAGFQDFDSFLDLILGLYCKKADAGETMSGREASVTPPELPTESFDLMSRFLGGASTEPMDTESGEETLSDDMKETVKEESQGGEDAAALVAPHADDVALHAPSSSSQVNVLETLDLLSRLEPQPDQVVRKVLSHVCPTSLSPAKRPLLLTCLRFCTAAFTRKRKPQKSKDFIADFLARVQNLSVVLSLRSASGGSVCVGDASVGDASVGVAILKALSAFAKIPPKHLDGQRLKVVLPSVEVLLTLPPPPKDDMSHLLDFFLLSCDVANSLLIHRATNVFKMAPTFFTTVDKLLRILADLCSCDQAAPPHVRACATSLSRVTALLRPHKSDVAKLAPYWVSHFTRVLAQTAVADAKVKKSLLTCVFCLLDLMDDLALDLLRTMLPAKEKELLREINIEYEATFKFKGKI